MHQKQPPANRAVSVFAELVPVAAGAIATEGPVSPGELALAAGEPAAEAPAAGEGPAPAFAPPPQPIPARTTAARKAALRARISVCVRVMASSFMRPYRRTLFQKRRHSLLE